MASSQHHQKYIKKIIKSNGLSRRPSECPEPSSLPSRPLTVAPPAFTILRPSPGARLKCHDLSPGGFLRRQATQPIHAKIFKLMPLLDDVLSQLLKSYTELASD
ncbi:hypothetical protein HPP92_028921 [Vanilla planifolia]|uniref:Uncharacterized protein n=1 Tax=Vanilla planifolia TaxID=51239 RepID=A0A835P676_VANPL|nr:hypothetical protein HPP92_028911 [Vanilla planifolia]KAG0446274.1 hypothetical protein HPP92_028921 [Vanilla planifolia]